MEQKASVFRSLYHHFGILELNEQLRQAVRSFPGAQEGDHVLVYGYIDRSAGLTLEVLATGHLDGQRMSFFNLPDDCRLFFRFSAVSECGFLRLEQEEKALRERFAQALERLHDYDADQKLEALRDLRLLDPHRHPAFPDDVLVFLTGDGVQPEGCWLRLQERQEDFVLGSLLNEPDQNFICHKGDVMLFRLPARPQDALVCPVDLDGSFS